MVLCEKRITKALIRLRGCAGWSAPVLFANPRRQVFSRRGPNHSIKPYKVRNRRKSLPFNETMRNTDKVACAYAAIQWHDQHSVRPLSVPPVKCHLNGPLSYATGEFISCLSDSGLFLYLYVLVNISSAMPGRIFLC